MSSVKKSNLQLLKSLMEERGLSEDVLANKLNISRSYMNHIKNGRRPISNPVAQQLSKIFDTDTKIWLAEKRLSVSESSGVLLFLEKLKSGECERSGPLVNHEIYEALSVGLLGIDPLDESKLDSISYNFRNGSAISGEKPMDHNFKKKEFVLAPQESAIILTTEKISMPSCMSGRLDVTSTMLNLELSIDVGGCVHPSWSGHIQFRVTSCSDKPVVIEADTELVRLSLYFLPVEPSEKIYQGNQHSVSDQQDAEDMMAELQNKLEHKSAEEKKKIIEVMSKLLEP